MLDEVTYSWHGKEFEVSFSRHHAAKLPVKLKDKQTKLIPWGRHKSQPGELLFGSFVHLDMIYSGRLNKFKPRSVKLPVKSFKVYDFEQRAHWYEVINGQYIQGMVASMHSEQRVYIVVIDPDNELDYHPVWPRIIWA